MANIYIWFPNGTERREFIINILELKPTDRGEKCGGSLTKGIGQTTEIAHILNQMKQGKTRSLYFALNKEFYGGCLPDIDLANLPMWHKVKVFQRGFRQVYAQKTYYRPRYWLAMQLRNNKAGREKRAWILSQILKERIGVNIPPAAEGIGRITLVWAKGA